MTPGRSQSKLLPRDISESLGKLPPQAIELEEVVLGALMLESTALEQVPYLKAEHFYMEAHRTIMEAILQISAAKDPVDMNTVRTALRKTGKLELVGGSFKVAELTSKVSSAANIDTHARVIVEQSMKRSLIEIASKIHHDAYEDTTDVFELFESTLNEITHLQQRETRATGPERIKAIWEDTLVTVRPIEPPPLLYIDGVPIATPGNHSLLVGKKKSRKSLLIVHLIAEYLKTSPKDANSILLFDTEQGRGDVFKIREKIHQITGLFVPIFYLRGRAPAERREIIAETVKYWSNYHKDTPKIVVIDGVRDLMSNINDPDETTEVLVWLERLTLQHNLHVMNVLHLNKTDNNARGHIGSELLNKAEITMEVEYDQKTTFSVVKCESSRRMPFTTFAFWHDHNGLPEVVGVPVQGNIMPVEEKNSRWDAVFQDGALKYKELMVAIKAQFACGQNKAGSILAEAIRRGQVAKFGKSNAPDTVYKLMMMVENPGIQPGPIQTPVNGQHHIFTAENPTPDVAPSDLPF